MKNLSSSFNKFLGNKNTVTILGVLLIVVILGIGYNARINQKTSLKSVPVAKETIGPKTEITDSMVEIKSIPTDFLTGSFYEEKKNVVGKYTNYNATIAKGSLFYADLIVNKEDVPDLIFQDLESGYRPAVITIDNIEGLYGGPGDYVDIYFSGINDNNKIMFGEFLSGIEVLAIVDESGKNAYGTVSEETGEPAYLYLAVPEEVYMLLGRYERLNEVIDNLNSYLVLTPHAVAPDVEKVDIYLTSDDIRKLINDNSDEIDKIEEKIEVQQ